MVAEELHFGRAAERLHVAQSPLSRQIQGLERDLSTVLLRRTTRSVSLTPAGSELLARGRRILQQVDETVQHVRDLDQGIAPVRMGFTACSANALLGRVLHVVQAETGELPVDLRTDLLTPTQLGGLVEDRIDIGFMVRPISPLPPGLRWLTLVVEPLSVVLPDAHPLVACEAVPLADMADDGFVAFSRASGSAVRRLFDSACRGAGFRPWIVHEARETATLLGLVAAGVGSVVLPLAVRAGVAAGATVRPLLDGPAAEIAMVWRAAESRLIVRDVIDAVVREFETSTSSSLLGLPVFGRAGAPIHPLGGGADLIPG